MYNVEKCVELFDDLDIYSHKDFKKWALKNHPDKGGSVDKFQIVSSCEDFFKEGLINRPRPSPKSLFKLILKKYGSNDEIREIFKIYDMPKPKYDYGISKKVKSKKVKSKKSKSKKRNKNKKRNKIY
jgi:hypothetical protein